MIRIIIVIISTVIITSIVQSCNNKDIVNLEYSEVRGVDFLLKKVDGKLEIAVFYNSDIETWSGIVIYNNQNKDVNITQKFSALDFKTLIAEIHLFLDNGKIPQKKSLDTSKKKKTK